MSGSSFVVKVEQVSGFINVRFWLDKRHMLRSCELRDLDVERSIFFLSSFIIESPEILGLVL